MSTSVPPPGWSQQRQQPALTPPGGVPAERGSRARSRSKLVVTGALMAVLVAAAFLLLGNGGPGFDPIARAAALSARSPGYRMHMSLAISSPVLGTAMTANADAVVDLRDRASSMSMVMTLPDLPQVTEALGGNTLSMDMRVEGTIVYFRFPPALAAKLPYDKPWLKLDLGRLLSAEGLSAVASMINNPVSTDPASQLSYLRAASGDVLDEGAQAVDGVLTTHYHASIDFSRVADAVPAAERAATSQAMSRLEALLHTDQVPVDVWIDHQHHVRRMTMTLSFAPTGSPAVQESITADMSDYGPQPRPSAPPADEVQDITATPGL
jgi:hypothetical protein